jgi:hypothetical protein
MIGAVVSNVTESIPYEVVKKIGEMEIRQYRTIIVAQVDGLSDNQAFRILFRYITGSNSLRQDVAMTTPVISQGPTYEEIAMTRPVISDERSFAFVMPPRYSITTIPQPSDERIKMVEVQGRTLAVLRFSGRMNVENIKKKERQLLGVLEENRVMAKGKVFLMRYNGPGTPGFLRRNEVAVEIEASPGTT